MLKKILLIIGGIALGIGLGWGITYWRKNIYSVFPKFKFMAENILGKKKEVIGFLPYWLLDKAQTDYSRYISTLTYFSLTLENDGTIKKYNNPGELEPGWYTLTSGKAEPFLTQATKSKVKLSLLVFSGNNDNIAELLTDPTGHARQLLTEIKPVMQEYGFTDLNMDIENGGEASDEARMKFGQFIRQIKNGLEKNQTLTIDITGDDLVKRKLIDVAYVGQMADRIVIMAYDYHSPGSSVTGPVSPLGGGGSVAEYDVQTAVAEALRILPAEKIILGIPLYGYEWETIGDSPRSGIIPGSGMTASNFRVEELLKICNDCIQSMDEIAKEAYVIFKGQSTGIFHQIFYPDKTATEYKVNYAIDKDIGGLALWALGYEGKIILEPLTDYLVK